MRPHLPLVAALLWFAFWGGAETVQAQPRFDGRLLLTGMVYAEQESSPSSDLTLSLASPTTLAFGELRTLLRGQDLWQGRLDLGVDLRVRATGNYDFERKFAVEPLTGPLPIVTARGYRGGPEFDLRDASIRLHWGERFSLRLGRQFVAEADGMRTDGIRAELRVADHWNAGGFVGGAPHLFSRSLLTDYDGLFSMGGGGFGRYSYAQIWGSAGATVSGGNAEGDGGPVVLQPIAPADPIAGNLQPPDGATDPPRVYVTWFNYIRPLRSLDVHSQLVVDLFGSAGPQLTRALLSAALRLLRHDRLSLRISYAHMSSVAINMFLRATLYNRSPNGVAPNDANAPTAGFVENNLTVLRTARDEVRFNADLRLSAKLATVMEARVRSRSLIGGDSNPTVYGGGQYSDFERPFAGDISIGLRDGGSLAGIRLSASYLFLADFRAQNHVTRASIGRDFFRSRVGVDADYAFRATTDVGQSSSTCADNLAPSTVLAVARLSVVTSPFALDCFGRRSGQIHEGGLAFFAVPLSRLLLFADYHFAAVLTDPQAGQSVPTVLIHTAVLRIESRL